MFDNCIHCGTYTKLTYDHSCPTCHKQDERLLGEARKILSQMGKMTASELADMLGVSLQRVSVWLKGHRLDPSLLSHRCSHCGKELVGLSCDCQNKSFFKNPPSLEKSSDRFHCPIRRDKRIREYWGQGSNILTSQRRTFWVHGWTTAKRFS